MKIQFSLLTILLILFFACSSDDGGMNTNPNIETPFEPCSFVQVDENMDGLFDDEERELWETCIANEITNEDDIRNNIIGEWELVGYVAGWFPHISEPCSRILITEDEVLMDYHSLFTDTTITFPYKIDNSDPFRSIFEISQEELRGILPITAVSEDLMVGPERIADADIHIYQRVK